MPRHSEIQFVYHRIPNLDWTGIYPPPSMELDTLTLSRYSRVTYKQMNSEYPPTPCVQASLAVKERYKVLGADPDLSSPEEFREPPRRETVKWAHPTKFSGAKLD